MTGQASAHRSRRYRARIIIATTAIAVTGLIAGCGPELAGSAAVVGDQRITDKELSQDVDRVTQALGIETSERANQLVLQRLITSELISILAERENIAVTEGQVRKFIDETVGKLGGREAFDSQLLQLGVIPEAANGFVRVILLQQALGEKLAPGEPAEAQGQAIGQAIITLSEELNTRVSPRFGTWDARQLAVGPTPNDLSVPATGQRAGLVPVPAN